MRGIKCKSPPQGLFNWKDVVKYLEEIGALNKKYDSDLDGVVDNAAAVGGHSPGTSAGDVLVLNTAGQVPLSNLPLIPDSQLDFSFAWEKVAEISETGVASVSITGLAGDTDKFYRLIFAVNNPNTGATNGIYARFNADTTVGHYGWLGWSNAAGTVTSASQSFGATSGIAGTEVGAMPGTSVGLFDCIIHTEGITHGTTTYVFAVSKGFNTNPVRYDNCAGGWKKSAEVTEITLFTGSGVTLDWKVYLFKPKW